MQIDEEVLTSSQKKDNTVDRILDSLEKVAGSVADTETQTLDTKNIKIKATRASLTRNITLVVLTFFVPFVEFPIVVGYSNLVGYYHLCYFVGLLLEYKAPYFIMIPNTILIELTIFGKVKI